MNHVPVMLRECIEGLHIHPDGIYVDCTLGRGGHSFEVASRLSAGKLFSLDRDEQAIQEAGERLKIFRDRVELIHANFRDLVPVMTHRNVTAVDGVLFDLGVSSPQLDDPSRGFSYMADAPLDMRMDQKDSLTAGEIVNRWDQEDLRKILFEYGEERYAPLIASAIVREREKHSIETTGELVEVVRRAMPARALREKQHPAKRTFQALRIAVNDELSALRVALDGAAELLRPGGRLVVISFHSLEDRVVKEAIRQRENGCTCPPGFPVCVCGFRQTLKSVNKKPLTPGDEELRDNPRARSARVRIAERI